MARKKKDRSKKRKKVEPRPQRRGNANEAIKGMMTGVVIFLLIAFCFFVKVGGETPFNHLVGLFPEEPEKEQRRGKADKTSKTTIPSRIGQSAANAPDAPPQEKLTDSDKDGLDRLIKSKTK